MRLRAAVGLVLALTIGPTVLLAQPAAPGGEPAGGAGTERAALDRPASEAVAGVATGGPDRGESPVVTASLPGSLAPATYRDSLPPVHTLHWAAIQNRPDLIELMVSRGTPVDIRDRADRTALMAAAAFGNLDAARVLLEIGADPLAHDETYGDTPLHYAARAGKNDVVELLLDSGVPPGTTTRLSGETPLHAAATFGHKATIRLLVARGADPNAADIRGISPIHYASRRLRTSVVALLADLGARHGGLHEAVNAEDVGRVLSLLNAGADVDARDLNGTALHSAAARGSLGMAGILIDAGADLEAAGEPGGARPLHIAAISNQTAIVGLLLERGAQLESRDDLGRTPLHVAASFGSSDSARVFLEHGADPLAADDVYGDAPIHKAALAGSRTSVELLLARQVDINLRSGHLGETPLHYAVKNSAPGLIEWLISNGADPTIRSRTGETALDYARLRSSSAAAESLLLPGEAE